MKKYQLFIRVYDLYLNDYTTKERLIETDDIYHTIGYIYCTTIEDIKRIDYFEVKDEKRSPLKETKYYQKMVIEVE